MEVSLKEREKKMEMKKYRKKERRVGKENLLRVRICLRFLLFEKHVVMEILSV